MNVNTTIPSLLERTLNAFLGLDAEATESLHAISGKVIQLKIRGLALDLFVMPVSNRVNVQSFDPGTVDTCITGSPLDFARLGITALSGGSGSGGLEIQGDIESGLEFQKVLSKVEFDWEETLAQRLGDIPAHQIGNLLRAITGWIRDTRTSVRLDISEYLQEESRLSPGRLEQEYFLNESDILRNDIDRLEARLRRLEAHPPKAGT